jgi:hypothetical protein
MRYENLVLGSSAEAYAYAFENQYPILDSCQTNHFHDHLELVIGDFSFAGLSNEKTKINTNLGEMEEWIMHKETIRKLLKFCLGMNGHAPFGVFPNMKMSIPSSIYVDADLSKVTITRRSESHEISYGNIHVMGVDGINGSLYKSKTSKDVIFVDYLTCQSEFNRGGIELDSFYCQDEDNAISEVHFAKAPENNVIIKSNFEIEDVNNPEYAISSIILGAKNAIKESTGATPYFRKYRHGRKVIYNQYDKEPLAGNIVLVDGYDITRFLNNNSHDNDNYVRILQLTMKDENAKEILENYRPETDKRISFQRKKSS